MSYQQKRGKNTSWRNGLMRNLTTELIINGRLEVIETRAKELRRHIEKVITLSKRQDLHARRRAASFLRDIDANEKETVLQKLFNGIAKKYKNRNGGYTRILKIDNRKGDNAPMSIIELI